MTVTTTTNKVVCLGDGSNKTFTYSFTIPTAASAVVIYTDALGVQTTLSSGQYTITGIGGSGGVVTYPLTGPAIALGTTLTIQRVLTLTQPISISNQGAFYPQVVEAALDLLCMEIQQISAGSGGGGSSSLALTFPPTDVNPVTVLPTSAQRANKVLLFDSLGNPTAGSTIPAGTVSSAMQPVINAASLAAGRTALGLGAMATEGMGAGLQDNGSGSARVTFATVAKNANYLVASTDHDTSFITTGNIVFTLPAISTLWNGFGFWAAAYGGTLTLTPNAANAIEGNATGASSYIPSGAKAYIYTDGAGWGIKRCNSFYASMTPGGYLTPTSGTPVIYGDVSAATMLFYTADVNGFIPIYNGVEWINFPFTELFSALNASQQAANEAHDVFVSLQSGVPTLVIGPAWRQAGYGQGTGGFTSLSNATPIVCNAAGHGLSNGDTVFFTGVQGNTAANGAWTVSGVSGAAFTLTGSVGNGGYVAGTGTFASRGNGAGTTQLARVGGLYVNSVLMTAYNGATPYTIPANQATYVGSILIDSVGGQISFHRSIGQSRKWSVWNAYNRKTITLQESDPAVSWTYSGLTRVSAGNAANNVMAFVGLPEESISTRLTQTAITGVTNSFAMIGYATTAVESGASGRFPVSQYVSTYTAHNSVPTIGAVMISSLENAYSSTTYYSSGLYMALVSTYRG